MDPMKERLSADEIIFSEWLESIRKDVECAFGILKMRFRILLNRVEYHDPSFVDLIFRCCAILHNMLVHWDGINYRAGQMIAYFRGTVVTKEEYDTRENQTTIPSQEA